MVEGLCKIHPDRKDYSLVHTFGALNTGLPTSFSIYDGRIIPDQNELDDRFVPAVRPLPMGCTAESQTFAAGLADKQTYLPDDFYFATPPGTDGTGRDMRVSLQTAIDYGFKRQGSGIEDGRRKAYFNCYGAGGIDDFDAARMALWLNQSEKRAVSVGSWWYPNWTRNSVSRQTGILPLPSFNTKEATLHNWLVTGWGVIHGVDSLEVISWQGEDFGRHGICYISRAIYNALMAQPYTGAFTMTKLDGTTPVPIGYQAVIDHFIYWFRNLLKI